MSFKDNLSNNDFLNDEKHKPKVKYVREHVNHINFCDNKGRVFCRLTNKIEFLSSKQHRECPYIAGGCQGQGIECEWEDYLPENYRIPYVESPQDEYKRVKELIKQGLLPKIAVRRNLMNEGKYKAYQKLVKERQACTCCKNFNMKNGNDILKENDINDIGLWTYSHTPGEYNLDAEILIIGQDWGNEKYINKFIEKRKQNAYHTKKNIPLNKSKDITTENLYKALSELGSKIDLSKQETPKSRNYFLTNIVLCYKTQDNMNAKVHKECYVNCKNRFLDKLINIIEPKIIITLGRNTFEYFWNTYDSNKKKCCHQEYRKSWSFSKIIEQGLEGNFKYMVGNNQIIVFPMAHTGKLGTINRQKSLGSNNSDAFLIDWEKLNKYITK